MAVTDQEYETDMAELSDHAAGIVRRLKDELREARLEAHRVAWMLVKAAGGKVVISESIIQGFNPQDAILRSYEDVANSNRVFETAE